MSCPVDALNTDFIDMERGKWRLLPGAMPIDKCIIKHHCRHEEVKKRRRHHPLAGLTVPGGIGAGLGQPADGLAPQGIFDGVNRTAQAPVPAPAMGVIENAATRIRERLMAMDQEQAAAVRMQEQARNAAGAPMGQEAANWVWENTAAPAPTQAGF